MASQEKPRFSDETCAARGGHSLPFVTAASTPPVYMTTAFDLEDLGQLDEVATGQQPGYIYTRDGNPNIEAFARDVAVLEGAEAGAAMASGMGALTAFLLSQVQAGDHIIAGRVLYGRTGQMLNHLSKQFGLQVTFVEIGNHEAVRAAIQPNTRLCIAESLSNPLVEVLDIPGLSATLQEVPLLVDNTFASPCLLKPIEWGATFVWHSASKYLNGHGDVMLGVMAGPTAAIRKVRAMSALYGLNSNPMEAWLGSRGLRTLPLRMRQVSQTAFAVAQSLAMHPQVGAVFYPGLPSHPTHHLAQKLLPHGMGGMLAIDLQGGRATVDRFFRRLAETIPFSPTLADTRTTLSYPAGTSHKFMTAQERAVGGITDGLVRISVGLEAADDLIREFSEALSKSHRN